MSAAPETLNARARRIAGEDPVMIVQAAADGIAELLRRLDDAGARNQRDTVIKASMLLGNAAAVTPGRAVSQGAGMAHGIAAAAFDLARSGIGPDPAILPAILIAALDAAACAPDPGGYVQTVLSSAVESSPQTVDQDTRPSAILPHAARRARLHKTETLVLSYEPTGPVARTLPMIPDANETSIVPALPIELYSRLGGRPESPGQGAPAELRLFFEALMAVGLSDRNPDRAAILRVSLRTLTAWLWPGGWQRGRDLPRLQRALIELDSLRIEWERRLWRLVGVDALPTSTTRLDDDLTFRICHLPGSDRGPMVDRERLRRYGLISAPLWRSYLRLVYLWDAAKTRNGGRRILATRPEVWRGPGGVILNASGNPVMHGPRPVKSWAHPSAVRTGKLERNPSADRVPALNERELVELAFDASRVNGSTFRSRLERAREAVRRLEQTGGVVVEHSRDGVRLIEPGLLEDDRPPTQPGTQN